MAIQGGVAALLFCLGATQSASGYYSYSSGDYYYNYNSYASYYDYGGYYSGYYSNYYSSGRSEYPYGMAGWKRTYAYADYPLFYSHCLPQDAECTQDSAVYDWIWAGIVIGLFCCFVCGGACCKVCCKGFGACCGCKCCRKVATAEEAAREQTSLDESYDYDKKQREEDMAIVAANDNFEAKMHQNEEGMQPPPMYPQIYPPGQMMSPRGGPMPVPMANGNMMGMNGMPPGQY